MLHELTLAMTDNGHLPSLAIAKQRKRFTPPLVLAVALDKKMLNEGKNCAAEIACQPQQADGKDPACTKIESYVDPTAHDSRFS